MSVIDIFSDIKFWDELGNLVPEAEIRSNDIGLLVPSVCYDISRTCFRACASAHF